jgi:ClpP class serine protease
MRSINQGRAAAVLAALSLMLVAGACSRSNKSAASDTRGTTMNRDTTSVPTNVNNGATDNTYNGTNNGTANPANMGGDNDAANFQKDWADFRNEIDKKVADNQKLITEKRADLANAHATTAMRSEFKRIIDDAEQQNHELQQKVGDYHFQNDQAWGQFKDETRNALDAVAASLNKIDVKK